MNTAMINNKRERLTYRTNSEMSTLFSHDSLKIGLYGADVYSAESGHVVIVATSGRNGATIKSSTTILSNNEYELILDLHDTCNATDYHIALMNKMGFR